MNASNRMSNTLFTANFFLALAINFVWINASEIFRYFLFVMPLMRDFLAMVPDVAPMNMIVFLSWGVWDLILVFTSTTIFWMCYLLWTPTQKVVLLASTLIWLTVFIIFWLGLWNMNLTSIKVLTIALPLAWIEMFVAALIARACFNKA